MLSGSMVGLGEGDGDTIAGRKLGVISQIGLRGEGEGDAGKNVYFDRSIGVSDGAGVASA
jgi:hypothetical protein